MSNKCKDCGQNFLTPKKLYNHRRKHLPKYHRCSECGYSTNRQADFLRHERTVHKSNPTTEPISPASTSSSSSSNIDSVAENVNELAQEPSSSSNMDPANDKFQCTHHTGCKYKTHSQENMNRHIRKWDSNKRRRMEIEATSSAPEHQYNSTPFPEVEQFYMVNVYKDWTKEILHNRFVDWRINFINFDKDENGDQIEMNEVWDRFRKILHNIFFAMTREYKKSDKVRIVIQSQRLKDPISIPMVSINHPAIDMLMKEIVDVLNSNENFVVDGSLNVNFVVQSLPELGGGWKQGGRTLQSHRILDKNQFLKKLKRSVITMPVYKKDNLCAARAIVTGKHICDMGSSASTNHKNRPPKLTNKAKALMKLAKLSSQHGCGIHDIDTIQQLPAYKEKYQLEVYSTEHCMAKIYEGVPAQKKIRLLLNDAHYSTITSMSGLLNKSYYCEQCDSVYSNRVRHMKCAKSKCTLCHLPNCLNTEKRTYTSAMPICMKCNCTFRTHECLSVHEKVRCKLVSHCFKCNVVRPKHEFNKEGVHLEKFCGKSYCKVCQSQMPIQHEDHYVQKYKQRKNLFSASTTPPLSSQENSDEEDEDENESTDVETVEDLLGDNDADKNEAYFLERDGGCMADSEALDGDPSSSKLSANDKCKKNKKKKKDDQITLWYYDLETEFSTGTHKVNLVIMQNEKGEEFLFYGDSSLNDFVKWMITLDGSNIFIAHNASAFNCYPILKFFYEHAFKPKLLTRGQSILQMKLLSHNLIFKDSLQFLPFRLAEFSNAFDLEEQKGLLCACAFS